ncbi:DMT family transporter [Polaromonas sp.]|uniref:DMT family transporter n=1 Tax=Polaromonas sp. TaxID=1869339 RepID=UPI0032650E26
MLGRNWILLMVTSASFATSLTFNKVIVVEIGPFTLAFLRTLLALPLLLAILPLLGATKQHIFQAIRPALLAGLLLVAIPFTAISYGQQTIASGLGGILYASMPLFTIVFANFMIEDEKITAIKIVGILIGMVGVAIAIGPDILINGIGHNVKGELVTLIAPLSYALGTVYLRRHRNLHPVALFSAMFIVATLVMLPVIFLLEEPLLMRPSNGSLVALAGLATVGTALPAVLSYLLIQRAGATNASLSMFFTPLFAIIYGTFLLGERLPPQALLGLVLIILGSIIVTRLKN